MQDSDMEIQLQQQTGSPVKRVISTIPEGHERSPEIENCSFSRLSQNESRAMMSRALSRNLTRASFKIPTLTGGRNSRTFLVDTGSKTPFDPEDEYDFDFESDEEESSPTKYGSVEELHKHTYRNFCKQLGVMPCSHIIRQFGKTSVNLADLNLSNKELKAVFLTIIKGYTEDDDDFDDDNDENDGDVCEINMSGNKLRTKEVEYLTDLLTVNKRVSHLILCSCNLSGEPIEKLAEYLKTSNTVQKLDLSNNELTDRDAQAVCRIIQENESIMELILSHNNLGESGVAIGEAIANNDTMRSLDLSWNHIRVTGAVGLAKGVKNNCQLEKLSVAWNGFGFEGSVAIGKLLEHNTSLHHLDLSCNRIHPPALFEIIKGLEKNKTLCQLNLSRNPITAPMTSILLTRLLRAKHSALQELDLAGVVVDKEFEQVLEKIRKKKPFVVRYDESLPVNKGAVSKVDAKNVFNIDPIRILYFMKEHLRTIDLFLKFDKDSNNFLTRDEMQLAFEMEGYPISGEAMDSVMSYLDTNKDGSVDLLEFIDGERKLKRKLIQEREERKLRQSAEEELRGDREYSQAYQRPNQSKLPPLKK
ncbi:uncharacterized protein LOC111123633 isoform X3 [Crassostrea virginica]